ncbi:SDR family oxidoreductase [Variovorax sp. H27-G14]|uniref:SDR family oxidoreductase n=1 Tax=Variovorax sp. H27-G14 TaxID=3111914 RepID=UPI0038FCA3CF
MTTKNWLITGTSSGIGRALTETLLARGDSVTATVRQADALRELQAIYSQGERPRLRVAVLDVTDTAAVRRTVDAAFAVMGRIDVVVSNAGYGLFGAAEEVSDAQIRHQLDTNLVGAIQVIRAALPHLRAQGGGRVLQVSSEGGQLAYPNFSLYHASKWGIEGFVESVAQEVAPFGISFTLVEPGPTKTNFGGGLVSPAPMPVYEDTPAGAIRRALASGAFPVTGDAAKMARAMADSVDQHPAPRRLALGSGTYASIGNALRERLAVLEAHKATTFATDVDE